VREVGERESVRDNQEGRERAAVALQRPQECAKWEADCILQRLMQRLLEHLQLSFDLHFADADPAEESAGDSLTTFIMHHKVQYSIPQSFHKAAC
jgi:hypothetical protein